MATKKKKILTLEDWEKSAMDKKLDKKELASYNKKAKK
jgi:hypothetical protein